MTGTVQLKVLILDFDGVIIESNGVKTDAFKDVFSRFPEHYGEMMDFHHANVSTSRYAKFQHLLELLGKENDADLKEEIARMFSDRVLKRILEVPLVSGAETFLSEMHRRLPVYLASVTPAEELALILDRRNLSHWFRAVYGCPPWNKSTAIADILNQEGVEPQEALLIGDSAGDQRAASVTGVRILGRNSGLTFDEPYPQCFTDLNEILKYLIEHIL